MVLCNVGFSAILRKEGGRVAIAHTIKCYNHQSKRSSHRKELMTTSLDCLRCIKSSKVKNVQASTTLLDGKNASLEVFLPGCALETLPGRYLCYNGDATSDTQEFRPKGFQKGAVEGVVLVSDGFDSPRVSKCEVSMS